METNVDAYFCHLPSPGKRRPLDGRTTLAQRGILTISMVNTPFPTALTVLTERLHRRVKFCICLPIGQVSVLGKPEEEIFWT
jgi:hypothetical protein